MGRTILYRTIWRWHFYAGVFVVPMVLFLAVTGATFLFKPQLDRWEERAFTGFPTAGTVSPGDQAKAALAAYPGARFHSYRLPRDESEAALVHLALPPGKAMLDVFVSPQGKVVGVLDSRSRITQVVQDLHGTLLLGHRGSWLVELAASWAIVMILTGLYLWWPAGRGMAGVLWPRLGRGSRALWRDLHAVTGFWVSSLALVLLITGLPWADAWGSMFKAVRTELGWVKGKQDWTIGGRPADAGEHAEHDHASMMAGGAAMPMGAHVMPDGTVMAATPVSLGEIVARAKSERLEFPVIVSPPGKSPGWSVKSETQDRPRRVTITYDAMTGSEVSRETFADKHVIDRVVGYGTAWHEGALFGWVNQLIGLATALMLVTLSVSGFVLWRRRKPQGRLGAPPPLAEPSMPRGWGFRLTLLLLLALLPLFTLSLLAVVLVERLVLPRLPRLAQWLGLARAA